MVTRRTHNCAIDCTVCAPSRVAIFIYSTKRLHVQSSSRFLIPGHRIYLPQNSSYLSSNFSIFRRNKVYRYEACYVKLHINHAYFLEAAMRFPCIIRGRGGWYTHGIFYGLSKPDLSMPVHKERCNACNFPNLELHKTAQLLNSRISEDFVKDAMEVIMDAAH